MTASKCIQSLIISLYLLDSGVAGDHYHGYEPAYVYPENSYKYPDNTSLDTYSYATRSSPRTRYICISTFVVMSSGGKRDLATNSGWAWILPHIITEAHLYCSLSRKVRIRYFLLQACIWCWICPWCQSVIGCQYSTSRIQFSHLCISPILLQLSWSFYYWNWDSRTIILWTRKYKFISQNCLVHKHREISGPNDWSWWTSMLAPCYVWGKFNSSSWWRYPWGCCHISSHFKLCCWGIRWKIQEIFCCSSQRTGKMKFNSLPWHLFNGLVFTFSWPFVTLQVILNPKHWQTKIY